MPSDEERKAPSDKRLPACVVNSTASLQANQDETQALPPIDITAPFGINTLGCRATTPAGERHRQPAPTDDRTDYGA